MLIEIPLTFHVPNEGCIMSKCISPFYRFPARAILSMLDQCGLVLNEYAQFIILDNWVYEVRR